MTKSGELRYIQSESHQGLPVYKVHQDLLYSRLVFSDIDFSDIDVLFLCMGHGVSGKFLNVHPIPANVKIIDLGNDFRLEKESNGFIPDFVNVSPKNHLQIMGRYVDVVS